MTSAAFADALMAARMCASDPVGFGGLVLRGSGPTRDVIVDALAAMLPPYVPFRRLPLSIDDDRLLGGVDLVATLTAGRPVAYPGILAETDGGFLVVPMAERISENLAARLCAVMDRGLVIAQRGVAADARPARFGLILLDDGRDADEAVPAALAERMAFRFDLGDEHEGTSRIGARPVSLSAVTTTDAALVAIAQAAAAFGIESARAPLLTLRAARAHAALSSRAQVEDEDVIAGARLVLAWRATRMPQESAEETAPAPPDAPGEGESESTAESRTLEDVVLDAVQTALPPDVLALIGSGGSRARPRGGGAGEWRKGMARGRPLGSRAGMPGNGARISLIDTLRAAAPWQRLRREAAGGAVRVRIRKDDIRVKRFEVRAEATTIFAVDASGSAAAARLGEAKGAVESLLGEAYVRRMQVALIAFRGKGAELLLPPTRSLTRARRCLADLPGGGGTPLSAGIEAARQLGEAVRARGRTPFIVLLTDGRANVAANGMPSREAAQSDAERTARTLRATGLRTVFIDTGQRPRPEGAALAMAMGAQYLPLPRADGAAMANTIRALQS